MWNTWNRVKFLEWEVAGGSSHDIIIYFLTYLTSAWTHSTFTWVLIWGNPPRSIGCPAITILPFACVANGKYGDMQLTLSLLLLRRNHRNKVAYVGSPLHFWSWENDAGSETAYFQEYQRKSKQCTDLTFCCHVWVLNMLFAGIKLNFMSLIVTSQLNICLKKFLRAFIL